MFYGRQGKGGAAEESNEVEEVGTAGGGITRNPDGRAGRKGANIEMPGGENGIREQGGDCWDCDGRHFFFSATRYPAIFLYFFFRGRFFFLFQLQVSS